jgi:chromosome segregation ATPase
LLLQAFLLLDFFFGVVFELISFEPITDRTFFDKKIMDVSNNVISVLSSVVLTSLGAFVVQRLAMRWRQGDAVTLMETKAKLGLYDQYEKLLRSMQAELARISQELEDCKRSEEKCKLEIRELNSKIESLEYQNGRLQQQVDVLKQNQR